MFAADPAVFLCFKFIRKSSYFLRLTNALENESYIPPMPAAPKRIVSGSYCILPTIKSLPKPQEKYNDLFQNYLFSFSISFYLQVMHPIWHMHSSSDHQLKQHLSSVSAVSFFNILQPHDCLMPDLFSLLHQFLLKADHHTG